MSQITQSRNTAIRSHEHSKGAVAAAYNESGDDYVSYADGDPRQLYSFDGRYGYGDRRTWETLFEKLCALRATGKRSLRILDIGCGPGTWLRRVVARARALGFNNIVARGFDIAADQVQRARQLSLDLAAAPGVDLTFDVGDIFGRFPEPDASVDLCLCLSSVLNHLPPSDIPAIFEEIARVTKGDFIATVRATGSTPSVYVDAIERARRFRQDNQNNRLDVEFENGRHISFPSHLYGAAELRSQAARFFNVTDLCGLDLFHGRFAGDPRWNPDCSVHREFAKELEQLEMTYCRDAEFVDHATHLLLVCSSRNARLMQTMRSGGVGKANVQTPPGPFRPCLNGPHRGSDHTKKAVSGSC